MGAGEVPAGSVGSLLFQSAAPTRAPRPPPRCLNLMPLGVSPAALDNLQACLMQLVVVLNPTSGRGRGARYRPQLQAALESVAQLQSVNNSTSTQWRIVETTGADSAEQLAKAAVAEGADVVVAAGGDGTCGAVVNGLMGSRARLGILPFGTGNDLARFLGIVPAQNSKHLELAVQHILFGTPRPVDVGRVNGRWFINVAGCGFDAVVADRINRGFRYLHGTPAYIAATLQSLVSFKAAHLRLTLDGETHELRAMLCAVANAQGYGGGMRVAPNAVMDDGLFDLCVIGDVSRLEFLRAFPRVFKGTHTTHPQVSMFRARHVVLESDPPLPVLVDGEIIGTTPAEFALSPRALEVMVP